MEIDTRTWTHGYGNKCMDSWTWAHGHWHLDMGTWTWTHGSPTHGYGYEIAFNFFCDEL